jgi:hypothetical protein
LRQRICILLQRYPCIGHVLERRQDRLPVGRLRGPVSLARATLRRRIVINRIADPSRALAHLGANRPSIGGLTLAGPDIESAIGRMPVYLFQFIGVEGSILQRADTFLDL